MATGAVTFDPSSAKLEEFDPSSAKPSGQAPDQSPHALGPWASAAVRPLARGANMILNFVPDMATDIANLIPDTGTLGKIMGPKMQRPSEAWDDVIDKYTTRPTTTANKVAEGVSSALVSGGRGAAELATATPGLLKAGAQKLYARISTRAAERAHSAGYKLPPSYIGDQTSKTVQTMSGGPKVEKAMSAHNEAVTDRLAQTELGLHPEFEGNELSEATFDALKTEAYQPYVELRGLGKIVHDEQFVKELKAAGGRFANRSEGYGSGARFASVDQEKLPYIAAESVDAGQMVDEVRQLRKLSRQNLKQYNPEMNALGYTQREIANAIENQLARAVEKSGNPQLMDRFRAARVQLSKIQAVEDSVGAGGHVNAHDLKRMLDAGTPLTGNLKTIAETAKNFGKAVQPVSKAGESGIWSAVDYLLGGTGIVEGSPGVALLSVARPISRWALGTKPIQKAMIRNMGRTTAGSGSQIAGALARGSALQEYEEDGR